MKKLERGHILQMLLRGHNIYSKYLALTHRRKLCPVGFKIVRICGGWVYQRVVAI